MTSMTEPTKRKLTLTIDGETIDLAHSLNLNISELTERFLRGYTLDPEGSEKTATRDQYFDLLRTMDPLLEKYGTRVRVGFHVTGIDSTGETSEDEVLYCGRGEFIAYDESTSEENNVGVEYRLKQSDVNDVEFLRPQQILKNFFAAIESIKARRREEVEGLALAKKLIEMLSEQELRRVTEGQSSGKTTKGE